MDNTLPSETTPFEDEESQLSQPCLAPGPGLHAKQNSQKPFAKHATGTAKSTQNKESELCFETSEAVKLPSVQRSTVLHVEVGLTKACMKAAFWPQGWVKLVHL